MLTEIKTLIAKDFRLEFRQKQTIYGILLYLVSTIFIAHLAFVNAISPETWNSLFWIILLFVAVNGISKSFIQENPCRQLYYYTISSPQAALLSKIIYNFFLMSALSALSFVFFLLLMGNPVVHIPLFLATLALGSLALSSVLTLVAAIASRAGHSFSLMAILAFPIVLPFLSVLMKLSRLALTSTRWQGSGSLFLILIAVNLSVIMIAYLLFPYLWKD